MHSTPMEKVIKIEVGEGDLEVTQHEMDGQWWETRTIELPSVIASDCNGIWEDEVIFNISSEPSYNRLDLRIPTATLLSLITKTRELVSDRSTHWWNSHEELREQFKAALGFVDPDPLSVLFSDSATAHSRPRTLRKKKTE